EVQRDPRLGRERAPELRGKGGIEITYAWLAGRNRHIEVQIRAAGNVDDGTHERLVERHRRVGEPPDSPLVPERLEKGATQHDAHVFDGVMRVDVQITLTLHAQPE